MSMHRVIHMFGGYPHIDKGDTLSHSPTGQAGVIASRRAMPTPPHPQPRKPIQEEAFASANPELASLATAQIRERQMIVAAAKSRVRQLQADYAATMKWMAENGYELSFDDAHAETLAD